jgi:ABC-type branched-subunit amino acid transport system ATPase component
MLRDWPFRLRRRSRRPVRGRYPSFGRARTFLALDARVLCLDEPTAGIAQRETEAFGPLLRDIQAAFGCSMLVIEHDMPMVMSLSDRV